MSMIKSYFHEILTEDENIIQKKQLKMKDVPVKWKQNEIKRKQDNTGKIK